MPDKEKDFEEWKIRHQAFMRIEKRKNVLKALISMFAIFFLSLIIYYWWTDELKFIGKETEYVNAVVTNERMIHWGRGNYYQVGNCDYIINGRKYTTGFEIWKNRQLARVGDTLVFKITTSNPEISKLH